jgi:hypothetical protein
MMASMALKASLISGAGLLTLLAFAAYQAPAMAVFLDSFRFCG